MLNINADDWGRCEAATDSAFACHQLGRISSASAMVFMEDSIRGCELAQTIDLDVGLHINFSEEFTGSNIPEQVSTAQRNIRRFLCSSKYSLLIYNPSLSKDFSLIYKAQEDEFCRLYGRMPLRVDGHQHLHLCMNVLIDNIITRGVRVRRSFSFAPEEKNWLNRTYRAWVDRRLAINYNIGDYFYSLSQRLSIERLDPILKLSVNSLVELMVHPQVKSEYEFLMSDVYAEAVRAVPVENRGRLSCARKFDQTLIR